MTNSLRIAILLAAFMPCAAFAADAPEGERMGNWNLRAQGIRALAMAGIKAPDGNYAGALAWSCQVGESCAWELVTSEPCSKSYPPGQVRFELRPATGTNPIESIAFCSVPARLDNGRYNHFLTNRGDVEAMVQIGGTVEVYVNGKSVGLLVLGPEGPKAVARTTSAFQKAGGVLK